MAKLSLNVADLRVESFEPTQRDARAPEMYTFVCGTEGDPKCGSAARVSCYENGCGLNA